MKRAYWTALLAIGILLCTVVFAPVPADTRWMRTLHNSAHAPIFGCVALLILIAIRAKPGLTTLSPLKQYGIALAGVLLLGILTELLQIPTGRDASIEDALHDVIGGAALLGLFAVFDERVRALSHARIIRCAAAVIGIAALAVAATPVARATMEYRQRDERFPVLADFSERYDRYFILQQSADFSPAPLPAQWASRAGEQALHVQLFNGAYPGMNFIELRPDWSGYSTLAIDLTNPTSQTLRFVVRVHDAAHNDEMSDRFNRRLELRAGTRQVFRIPLREIAAAPKTRRMDLHRIAGIIIFRTGDSPRVNEIYFSRAWLE
jgi:hypothetical protein